MINNNVSIYLLIWKLIPKERKAKISGIWGSERWGVSNVAFHYKPWYISFFKNYVHALVWFLKKKKKGIR